VGILIAGLVAYSVFATFMGGFLAVNGGAFVINVVNGPTCMAPQITIKDPNTGGYTTLMPAAISYTVTVRHIHSLGPLTYYTAETQSTCFKLVVNDGLDRLAALDGNNATGGPEYLAVSVATSVSATDHTCGGATGPYVSNGFTIANALSTYAHTASATTYTLTKTWTYGTTGALVIAVACMQAHSTNGGTYAATGLTDETVLGSTATLNNNGDQLVLTATVTI
jgi:hypothetical protein